MLKIHWLKIINCCLAVRRIDKYVKCCIKIVSSCWENAKRQKTLWTYFNLPPSAVQWCNLFYNAPSTPCPEKRCHWFFCCNFYKYWRIFIIFHAQLRKRMPGSHWRKNLLPNIHYVATIPCESLRHKSNTFHTNISTLHMFMSITFTETSIDETNKTQQKVTG